jgi:hypothetical protein
VSRPAHSDLRARRHGRFPAHLHPHPHGKFPCGCPHSRRPETRQSLPTPQIHPLAKLLHETPSFSRPIEPVASNAPCPGTGHLCAGQHPVPMQHIDKLPSMAGDVMFVRTPPRRLRWDRSAWTSLPFDRIQPSGYAAATLAKRRHRGRIAPAASAEERQRQVIGLQSAELGKGELPCQCCTKSGIRWASSP